MHEKLSRTNQTSNDSEVHVVNGHHQNNARKISDQKQESEPECQTTRSLKGIVAFITGGGSGLGEAVAKHLS